MNRHVIQNDPRLHVCDWDVSVGVWYFSVFGHLTLQSAGAIRINLVLLCLACSMINKREKLINEAVGGLEYGRWVWPLKIMNSAIAGCVSGTEWQHCSTGTQAGAQMKFQQSPVCSYVFETWPIYYLYQVLSKHQYCSQQCSHLWLHSFCSTHIWQSKEKDAGQKSSAHGLQTAKSQWLMKCTALFYLPDIHKYKGM